MTVRLTQHAVRLALCLVSFLLLAPVTQAATADSSVPSFSGSELHIPRMDVESLGSLEVTLTLVDPQAMIFDISDTATASSAMNPGATYDLETGLVNVPVIKVGALNYSAKLQTLEDGRIQIVSIQSVMLAGQGSYQQLCSSCHGPDGRGGNSGVSLFNCKWCGSASSLATYIDNTMPLGNPGSCNAACAGELASYLLTAFNTPNLPPVTRALDALSTASNAQTLRKAALQLANRLPNVDEIARVNAGGVPALAAVLNGIMNEPAFYNRLSEIFNDWLHTNRYLSPNGTEAAIGLLSGFPNARWFDPGTEMKPADYAANRITTNDSIATEPLELINYVARNNLPATEILTADYMMVNGYSAKSYGITDVVFANEWDPKEFKPAKLPGVPLAGVLTSRMFLNRYPTTNTNRNRARARVVYDLFLDVDILGLDGVRPNGTAVDLARSAPTMQNPDCTKCHTLLDPVASAFQNWSSGGRYSVPRTWYTDMFQAGFSNLTLPAAEKADQTGWLAEKIAADSRFDSAMVRLLYRGLTGSEPLRAPTADATTAEIEAYLAESQVLDGIERVYVNDGRKIKTLVREIVMSPYWRADGLTNSGFALVHEQTGSTQLLTPEMLHRKIGVLLGFEWRGPLDSYSSSIKNASTARLLSRSLYQQLYGGIDSNSVTERLADTNGLMAKVQERMANELACYAVPQDFMAETSSRRLFPHVETTTTTNTEGAAAIRANLQHLHRYLLDEEVTQDSTELGFTYQLFNAVLTGGRAKLASKTESVSLPVRCRRTKHLLTGENLPGGGLVNDPNYTLRAWTAVVAYLLSDYRFLYE